jgi:trehalose 6-phosphate phosphatase
MTIQSKAELAKSAVASHSLWLFLDYDGTLADFAPTPDVIRADAEVIGLLERLVAKPQFRVAVISGRRLEDLRLLLPVAGIFLAGTYGIEMLNLTGEVIHRDEYGDIRPSIERIKPQWEQIISGRKGFFLEDKGWALALHAGSAQECEAEEVILQARAVIGGLPPAQNLRILGGHRFLEIAPSSASKAEAVSYLLSHYPLPGARLLCIGDDDKDEEAFHAIHARGGKAAKVVQPSQASRPTEADFFFDSPAETLRWLRQLLQA